MINYDKKNDTYVGDKDAIDYFINVGFVITRKCVLECIHCCEIPDANDADTEKIKLIIDKLSVKKICVTGGEPLMRKDIVEILEYIHSKGINVTFSTNGILLNRNKLLQIKPFIDNIRFSIYGNEKKHDEITLKKGSYKKVIACLKMTKELEIPAGLIMTAMRKNLDDLADVIEICNQYNVSKLYLFSLMPTARGEKIYATEYVSPEIISEKVSADSQRGNKCVIKVIDWRIEGQCVLVYGNGDVVAQPSYQDKGNKKIVGNLLKESSDQIWDKYPFKKAHVDYYLNSH